MQRLVETQTLWGNVYRLRQYIDGKRVSRAAFQDAFDAAYPDSEAIGAARFSKENLGGGKWRFTWIVGEGEQ